MGVGKGREDWKNVLAPEAGFAVASWRRIEPLILTATRAQENHS
jgi:hypothetical protein